MPRRRRHPRLLVLLNNQLVGHLHKTADGAIQFQYAEDWLAMDAAVPISLSLPLREDAFRGEPVVAVLENLLPDSEALRRRVAERIGAAGSDAYSLLSQIGRDCVGALQFLPEGEHCGGDAAGIHAETITDHAVEKLLINLARAPLGLAPEDDFRISVAGAQEKTALLFHRRKWHKPHGPTPTTHILKPPIGRLPNGLDLSNSVENEYYCLRLMTEFGIPVNAADIRSFGGAKALVVERFDRRWTRDGRLLRLPQEDCCQALACPPSRKYQSQGGPGMVSVLTLLKGSDTPFVDQKLFLKAQMLFWLMGATDGHAKNASLFLGPGGRFRLAPFYDVLTAQPSLEARQVERKQMKLAMSVGNSRHYRLDEIQGRHFLQTAERAGLPSAMAREALVEIGDTADRALAAMSKHLPAGFPQIIHDSVAKAFKARLARI